MNTVRVKSVEKFLDRYMATWLERNRRYQDMVARTETTDPRRNAMVRYISDTPGE